MAKSKTGIGKIVLVSMLTFVTMAGIGTLIYNPFNEQINKEEEKVIDESRVAVSFLGSYGAKQTSVYAFFEHPDLAEPLALWDWAGVAPRSLVGTDGYDFITSNGGNSYTVEFTELLPLGYTSYEEYLNDDGALTVIISYAGENADSRIQTQNITLNESGNHIIGLPTASYESVSHTVEKFYKVVEKDDENLPEEPEEIEEVIVGVSWDRSSSTALTRLTKENDSIVNTNITEEPVVAVGTSNGSSQFDDYYPWSEVQEYNVIDNKIAYSRKDSAFSLTEYDVVVKIPTFYYKVVDTEESRNFYISSVESDGFVKHPGSNNYVAKYNTSGEYASVSGATPITNVTRADVRTNARAKGDNWSQYDFATWNAIQMLYLVEFADWDVQAKIGRGIVDTTLLEMTTTVLNTGGCDSMVYHTGRAEGTDGYTQVQYRYIEGLWGNVCEWVDGINIYDQLVYLSLDYKNYADDTEEGYTSTGVTLPTTGKITGVGHSETYPWAFLPNESIQDADYSTPIYVPDKVCSGSGWRILYTSNNYDGDSLAGLFRFSTSSASDRTHASYGCRLVYHGE